MFILFRKINNFFWKPTLISNTKTIINNYLLNKSDFTFLQVGSNDGKSNDPLHDFIRVYKCKGVLIEPVKYIFEKLKNIYDGYENIYLENVAISDEDSYKIFYEIIESNDINMPHWYNQLSSFSLKTIMSHRNTIPNIESLILEKKIQTKRISTILEKYNLNFLDILHIDTEGYDFEIIKTIDFDLVCPEILLYEHKHLSDNDYRLSLLKLRKYYNLIYRTQSGDTICYKKNN
jgi:FkbM family methyltransferase